MIGGRPPRRPRRAVLLALAVLVGVLPACGTSPEREAAAEPPALPATPHELEPFLVTEVPSGLPRLPDAGLEPPAGAKRLEDVATYADDPARERAVLQDYGYRHGWERFWGSGSGGGPVTGVFVDQFEHPHGAATYAADLARNDAELYRGVLSENPPDLPDGCRRLVVAEPAPGTELGGPAAFAWCAQGVFSVAVSSVAGSLDAALEELEEVTGRQLDALPGG